MAMRAVSQILKTEKIQFIKLFSKNSNGKIKNTKQKMHFDVKKSRAINDNLYLSKKIKFNKLY